jgi:CubicO group peptidase (beta-lactamase class C family)
VKRPAVTRVLIVALAAGAALIALAAVAPAALAQLAASRAAPGARAGRVSAADARRLVDSLLADYAKPAAPGASVVVIRGGRVVLERAYGLADVDSGVGATSRTDYRLASLTKQFTAMAVMILAERGTLAYDDPVTRWLPDLPAYARTVTVRHLLTHTSGLWAYEDFVPDSQTYQVRDGDVLRLIQRADSLYFPPGTAYRYSNTGYALLALVVEAASGMPFARFLRERIFIPAGMRGTVAYEQGVSTVPHRAYGHALEGERWVRADQSKTSAVLGDGGIYTSVEDLVRWYRALERHTLIREATQRLAWASAILADGRPAGYGFGWFVDRDARGLRLWHNGETRGFTNGVVSYPDQRLVVALLTNRLGGTPWETAQRIAELYLP